MLPALPVESPAPVDDCLTLAPPTRWGRKAVLKMRNASDSYAVRSPAGELLAVVYLWRFEDGSREFALTLGPQARRFMRALVRTAQLTLRRLAQDGVVVTACVAPGHLPGERMAWLTGFEPHPYKSGTWVYVWRL